MAIGLVLSVGLFPNVYSIYTGPIPNGNPGIGDFTFIVGFVLAGVLYYAFNIIGRRATRPARMAGSRARHRSFKRPCPYQAAAPLSCSYERRDHGARPWP